MNAVFRKAMIALHKRRYTKRQGEVATDLLQSSWTFSTGIDAMIKAIKTKKSKDEIYGLMLAVLDSITNESSVSSRKRDGTTVDDMLIECLGVLAMKKDDTADEISYLIRLNEEFMSGHRFIYSKRRDRIPANLLIESARNLPGKTGKIILEELSRINGKSDKFRFSSLLAERHGNAKETLLHIACRSRNISFASMIVNQSSNLDPRTVVDARDAYGYTPLHVIAEQGSFSPNSTKFLELLIHHGANLDASDAHGNTPLHLSARAGSDARCQLLINKGANINALSYQGLTPFDMDTQQKCPSLRAAREREALSRKKDSNKKPPDDSMLGL